MSLEALERSDLSRLPGGIFTRSFIRAYAQEVGLDPDRMIEEYIAELPPESVTARHAPEFEDGAKLDSDRKAVSTAMRLALFSLPIIGLLVYFGMRRPPPAEPVRTDAVSDTPSRLPDPVPAEAPVAPATPPPAAGQPSPLMMELAPRASCWVSVTVDGVPSFSGFMNPGERRVIQAKSQILLNVGDAGAFAYTVNGREGRPLGAPGEVVTTRISLSNAHEFRKP